MAAPPHDAALPEQGHMTLWEHLAELRRRLLICIVAVAVGGVVGWLVYEPLLEILRNPYCDIVDNPEQCQLFITDPIGSLQVRLQVSAYTGIALAMPVILWQLWAFITPALYPHEKRYAIPFIGSALVLFVLGAAIAYYTLPQALDFLRGLGGTEVTEIYTVNSYLTLIVYMMLAFGVGFEFPVVLVALMLLGVVEPRTLAGGRRMAAVVIVVVAAVITPSGDPISLLALSVPMYIFFELSILLGRLLTRNRPTDDDAA